MVAPTRRIGGFRRRFQFNEGTRRRALSHECNVWTADAWVSVLRHDDQSRVAGQEGKKCFEQLLKRRSKGSFGNVRVGLAEFSNAACVGLEQGCNGHGKQLANEQIALSHYL